MSDEEVKQKKGDIHLLYSAAEDGNEEVVVHLLAKPELAHLTNNKEGLAAFHKAAQRGHFKIVARMIAHDPELIAAQGWTALRLAVRAHRLKVVECLLDHGAVGIDKDLLWEFLEDGPMLFMDDILKLMLAHQPELARAVNHRGDTLLHHVFNPKKYHSQAMMRLVWEMNPGALHQASMRANPGLLFSSPFGRATPSRSRWCDPRSPSTSSPSTSNAILATLSTSFGLSSSR